MLDFCQILLNIGGFMNDFSQEILLVLLIGVIASATDTDLATNTNILLLILLFLSGQTGSSGSCCSSCPNRTSFFPF